MAEIIKNLKEILPKKSLNNQYLEILDLSVSLAGSEGEDLVSYCKLNGIKISSKEILKYLEKRLNFHIVNQIKILIKNQP